ncbi:MAG: hypothetical protein MMC33_001699 [Icmadophila ericetorum]|nr:hypothetical protein [Icmadophila ericetorum]
MSELEAIGAVASVAQIANYLLITTSAISHLYTSICNASARIKQYESGLKQLVGILELIQKNEWLQTDGISSIIQQIFAAVQRLQKMLMALGLEEAVISKPAKRYWRGFRIVLKEGEIVAQFASLEDKRRILSLGIQEVQTKYAGDTLSDVRKVLSAMQPGLEQIAHEHYSPAISPVTQCCGNRANQSNSGGENEIRNGEDQDRQESEHDTAQAPPPYWNSAGRLYMNATVGSNSKQLNGDFVGENGHSIEIRHIGPRVGDSSWQLNGNVFGHTEFLAAFFDGT